MKSLVTLLTLLYMLFAAFPAQAQHTKHLDYTIPGSKTKAFLTVKTGYPATGLMISTPPGYSFTGAYLISGRDTLRLSQEEDFDAAEEKQYSNLLTFPEPIDSFLFFPGELSGEITFVFIDARMPQQGPAPRQAKKKSSACSEPAMIEQQEWRVGLPDPEYDRIAVDVHNLIIHHTAGSNSDDNYIQTVRNIYISHTEVRGWSDIGYNYLIARDGTIFKGRDPGELEQDNVQGAHFCNYNSGTMGISIMGTFTDIVPPDTAIASLVRLLAWKAGKDNLDPLGTFPHTLNDDLPVIAGHRDGCATECPGQKLYAKLALVREKTWSAILDSDCTVNALAPAPSPSGSPSVSQQGNEIHISFAVPVTASVYTVTGLPIPVKETEAAGGKILSLPPGFSGNLVVVLRNPDFSAARLVCIP